MPDNKIPYKELPMGTYRGSDHPQPAKKPASTGMTYNAAMDSFSPNNTQQSEAYGKKVGEDMMKMISAWLAPPK